MHFWCCCVTSDHKTTWHYSYNFFALALPSNNDLKNMFQLTFWFLSCCELSKCEGKNEWLASTQSEARKDPQKKSRFHSHSSVVFLKTFLLPQIDRHGVFLTKTFPFCFTPAQQTVCFLCWLNLSTLNYFNKFSWLFSASLSTHGWKKGREETLNFEQRAISFLSCCRLIAVTSFLANHFHLQRKRIHLTWSP